MLQLLIRNKLNIAANMLRRGTSATRVRALTMGVLLAAVFGLVYVAARNGFDAIEQPIYYPNGARNAIFGLLATVPPGFFFACFFMLVTSAITIGFQTLYLAPELSLLMASPVPPRTIFVAKFLEAVSANSGLFAVFGLPILLAYAAAQAALSVEYLLMLLLVFAGFSAIATSIGLLACILLARVISPANALRTLGGLVMISFLLFFASSMWMMEDLHRFTARGGDITVLFQGRWADCQTMLKFPPWSWAGRVVSRMVMEGDFAGAIAQLAKLLGLGLGVVTIVSNLAGRLWYSGWVSGQDLATVRGKRRRAATRLLIEGLLFLLPAPIRGVALKDIREFGRDIRQLSLLVMPITAIMLLALSIRLGSGAVFGGTAGGVFPLIVAFVLVASLNYRIALSAFTNENRAFWILHSSPAGMAGILAGKAIFAYLVSGTVCVIALAVFYPISRIEPPTLGTALLFFIAGFAALCGQGIGLSALFADFNKENPRDAVSLLGRVVCLLMDLVYLGITFVLAGLVWSGSKLLGFSPAVGWVSAGVVVVLISAAFAIFPILIGARRLSRMEWT